MKCWGDGERGLAMKRIFRERMASSRSLMMICLFLTALLAFGCALGNRHVELGYPPAAKDGTGTAEAQASGAPAQDLGGEFLNPDNRIIRGNFSAQRCSMKDLHCRDGQRGQEHHGRY